MTANNPSGLTGDVITPTDPAYEQLRIASTHTGSPQLIVRCHTTQDVQHALAYARANSLEVSVRSGGHSGQGFGTNDGGIIIDLAPLNAVTITDPAKRTVRVEPGAHWGDVANALAAHGLAITAGDSKGVGVGGLMLGGGIGWMVRKYGLALDNLVAADVVMASGELLHASATEHEDLFWAIRGGGGNFGIVVAFEITAHPTRDVFFGTITYAADGLAPVLDGWAKYMQTSAPAELTTIFNIPPAKPGEPAQAMLSVCYASDDEAACDKAIQPLLALGATAHTVKKMPYGDILVDAHFPPFTPTVKSRFVTKWTPELTATLLAQSHAAAPAFLQLRSVGGALNKVPHDATAFAHRDAAFMLMLAQMSPQRTPAFDQAIDALEPYTHGMYGNLATTNDADDLTHMYPPKTLERLAHIKRAYDPDNVFAHNFNIKPAAS